MADAMLGQPLDPTTSCGCYDGRIAMLAIAQTSPRSLYILSSTSS